MIESHRRQMEIFEQNPNRIVKDYSHEFENAFLDGIKRSHLFGSVTATVVYNEFIKDRHHVHINSIQWHSLTKFVKHLGQIGKCKVEETSKGWFMTYIHRDFETLLGKKNKRIKFDMSKEDKQDKEIEKQIERAMHLMKQLSTIIVSNQPSHAYELAKVDLNANTMIRLSLGSCPKREGLPKAVFDLVEDVRKEEIRSL